MAVDMLKILTMVTSSTRGHQLEPRQFIPAEMATGWRDIQYEDASTMDTGLARSQSAFVVS